MFIIVHMFKKPIRINVNHIIECYKFDKPDFLQYLTENRNAYNTILKLSNNKEYWTDETLEEIDALIENVRKKI